MIMYMWGILIQIITNFFKTKIMAHKKPKKPKKPKASSSLGTWERYDARVKDWQKKCHAIVAGKKKKESLIKKHSHI